MAAVGGITGFTAHTSIRPPSGFIRRVFGTICTVLWFFGFSSFPKQIPSSKRIVILLANLLGFAQTIPIVLAQLYVIRDNTNDLADRNFTAILIYVFDVYDSVLVIAVLGHAWLISRNFSRIIGNLDEQFNDYITSDQQRTIVLALFVWFVLHIALPIYNVIADDAPLYLGSGTEPCISDNANRSRWCYFIVAAYYAYWRIGHLWKRFYETLIILTVFLLAVVIRRLKSKLRIDMVEENFEKLNMHLHLYEQIEEYQRLLDQQFSWLLFAVSFQYLNWIVASAYFLGQIFVNDLAVDLSNMFIMIRACAVLGAIVIILIYHQESVMSISEICKTAERELAKSSLNGKQLTDFPVHALRPFSIGGIRLTRDHGLMLAGTVLVNALLFAEFGHTSRVLDDWIIGQLEESLKQNSVFLVDISEL